MMKDDPIRPAHYTRSGIEPIKVIHAWDLNFDLGNVVKYIERMGRKKGNPAIQDLKKARQYLDFEIARREALASADNPHNSGEEQEGNG